MSSPSAFKLGMSVLGAALVVASLMGGVPACSSSEAECDSSQCLTGNKCLPLDGKTECRKTCSSNVDPATACPFGYTCVDTRQTGIESFCVKDTPTITRGPGQWGALCPATGGLDANPACDSAQGFKCLGVSTTDGAAYCTRYDCATDRDCAAGFTCQDINEFPDVTTDGRLPGATRRACIRRDFCAACTADLDCPPFNGVQQLCVRDYTDKGFCSPVCTDNKNCGRSSTCSDPTGRGQTTCYPLASTCVGDGSICEPCRSDKDCGEDGACVKGQYTDERSCAKKSTVPCKYDGKTAPVPGTDYACPAAAAPANTNIKCLGGDLVFDEVPQDYCHGLYQFGESIDIGCWSRRK